MTITKSKETTTVQSPGYARKTSKKKNPQQKEKQKKMEIMLVVDKLNDLTCVEIQRKVENQIQAQSVDTGNSSTTSKQTSSTTTADDYEDDESNEATVQ